MLPWAVEGRESGDEHRQGWLILSVRRMDLNEHGDDSSDCVVLSKRSEGRILV